MVLVSFCSNWLENAKDGNLCHIFCQLSGGSPAHASFLESFKVLYSELTNSSLSPIGTSSSISCGSGSVGRVGLENSPVILNKPFLINHS